MKYLPSNALSACCATALLLAACHNDHDSQHNSNTPAPVASTTVSGVAAVGSAIGNAKIDLNCNGYSKESAATTDNQGKWQASVPTSSLPCAIRLTGGRTADVANQQTLYSLAQGNDNNNARQVTANITPLTDLALAKAVNDSKGTALNDWYSSSSFKASLNDIGSQLDRSLSSILAQLKAKNYTLPADTSFNPYSSAFSAALEDAYDQLLEQFAAAIQQSGAASYTQFRTNYLSSNSIPSAITDTTDTVSEALTVAGSKDTATFLSALAGSYQLQAVSSAGGAATEFPVASIHQVSISKDGLVTIKGKQQSYSYQYKQHTLSDYQRSQPDTATEVDALTFYNAAGTGVALYIQYDVATGYLTLEPQGIAEAEGAVKLASKKRTVTPVCSSQAGDDKLVFTGAPSDFCGFGKEASANTIADYYQFTSTAGNNGTTYVKFNMSGNSVQSLMIENNKYAFNCGAGSQTPCAGITVSAVNNYKQFYLKDVKLAAVTSASSGITVNGLLIHFNTAPTSPTGFNTSACTKPVTASIWYQCGSGITADFTSPVLKVKTGGVTDSSCVISKSGSTVSLKVNGTTYTANLNNEETDAFNTFPSGNFTEQLTAAEGFSSRVDAKWTQGKITGASYYGPAGLIACLQ